MMQYLIIGTLAIFTVASVLYQFKSMKSKLVKFDKLNILPNYSFFAPKPFENDYRLVYKIIAEEESEWTEVPMYRKFNLLRIFWNPFKYYNKGMIDSCQFLLTEFNALKNKNFIQVSESYINILLVISKCLNRKEKNTETIRFAILASEGIKSVKIKNVVFASFHQII
jgi:hypothetical protein